MNFLSIDFSTDVGSLFVKAQNKTFIRFLQKDKTNNDLLMKEILDFFSENNLKFDDISQVYVNQGPGNFSGLRGSIATAKGICISKNLRLLGYNNFIWSCSQFIKNKDRIFSFIKFRDKYFLMEFKNNLKKSTKIKKVDLRKITKKFKNEIKVIPKNVTKNSDKKILKLYNLKIVDLKHDQLELLYLNGLLNEGLIKPFYVD